MGRYYTCRYCGIEGKGGYNCDCHSKKDTELAEKMIGATVVKAEIVNDEFCSMLVQTLSKGDETFEVTIYLTGEPGRCITEDLKNENKKEEMRVSTSESSFEEESEYQRKLRLYDEYQQEKIRWKEQQILGLFR